MATRIFTASTTYASEAARDAASGWGVGDVVYVTGVGYTVYDGSSWAALGGGGGAQSMSLLGPFAVEFDTPGLQSGGALLTELDAGTWLWGVAVVGVVAPAAATFLSFQVSLGGPEALDLDGGWSTSDSDDISPSPNNSVIVPGSGPFTAVTFRPVGLIIEGGLYANWGVVDATEGEWNIYALIATPA